MTWHDSQTHASFSFHPSTDNDLIQLDCAIFTERPKHLCSFVEPERIWQRRFTALFYCWSCHASDHPPTTSYTQNATIAINGTILTLAPESIGAGAIVATSTYWNTTCGCMKAVVGPAPTSVPGASTILYHAIDGNRNIIARPLTILAWPKWCRLYLLLVEPKSQSCVGGFSMT